MQRRPELFQAYVGVGQAVDLRAAGRSQYTDTIAWARRTGRADLAKQLTDLGPPPYADIYTYEPLVANEVGAFDYDRSGTSEGRGGSAENLNVPEYTLLEKAHALSGVVDGWDVLYPTMQDLDLRRQVAQLQAPRKERVVRDGAGHRSLYDRPGPFTDLLTRVLAETRTPGV